MNTESPGSDTVTQVGSRQATEMPETIGKYELRGEIGRGSCGVVYKGFDPFVHRDVALKVAKHDPEKFADTNAAQAHASFFTEARAAGMLQHPHIVSLYDAGAEGAISYIVMEYIDGDTLLPFCKRKGPRMPLEQVIEIAFQCARALDYSHEKGVLHRDIKPSNIMLDKDGVPKIMDFSIAEINEAPSQLTGAVGSPMYMSPEQVRAQGVGPASDLYSLGTVMYHLLTGEAPLYAEDVKTLFRLIKVQPAPSLQLVRPDLPEQLCEIVHRLLLKNPEERYASGQELATALVRQHEKLRIAEKQLARRENRDSLRRLHFFDTFSDEEIDEIINASQMLTFQPEQNVITEGEIDNAFYILARGSAEVRKGGKALHTLDKGDCFGEIAFLTAQKRTASVVPTSQALVLKVNSTFMDQVSMDCQLRFYKVFSQTLIYRLSVTSAKLSAISG